MYLKRFEHLYDLERVRIPEPPEEEVRLRLQRNEKPYSWPLELQEKIYTTVPKNLLQRYPDSGAFYSALSTFLNVSEEKLLVTSGIDEAIKSLLTLCCDPGDTFSVPWPGYAMYIVYARMFQAELTPIILRPGEQCSVEEVFQQVPRKAKILFLPNPGQPIENCFSLEELRELAVLCKERPVSDGGALLFAVDEAYHFFGAPSAIPLVDELDNVLVLRSFSKAFGGASLRLGYVIGSEKALKPLSVFRLAHEANALSLHAGKVLLESFDEYIQPGITEVCEGRDFIREEVKKLGFNAWGKTANHVLIDLETPSQVKTMTEGLKKRGVYVKGGFSSPVDHHMLVTCGSKDIMSDFLKAFIEVQSEI